MSADLGGSQEDREAGLIVGPDLEDDLGHHQVPPEVDTDVGRAVEERARHQVVVHYLKVAALREGAVILKGNCKEKNGSKFAWFLLAKN